jgi:hypothetical protein
MTIFSRSNIQFEQFLFTFTQNGQVNGCSGGTKYFQTSCFGGNAGHIFAVNGNNLVTRFEAGTFSGRPGNGADDGEEGCGGIYIRANAFIGPSRLAFASA